REAIGVQHRHQLAVVLAQHRAVRVARQLGGAGPGQPDREPLGEAGDGPQPLVVLDEEQQAVPDGPASARHPLTGSGPKPGTGTSPSRCRKPSRQVRYCGAQPSSALAFAFEVPRIRVIIDTPTSPAASRPSHTGTRSGGLAPTASASSGSHTDTGSGSSSAPLYTPRRPWPPPPIAPAAPPPLIPHPPP